MTNELAKTGIADLMKSNMISNEEARDISSSKDFIPGIRLFIASSNPCKRGMMPMNHFGITRRKDEYEDLGERVDALVFGSKHKALDTEASPVIANYEVEGTEFNRIKDASRERDSGCSWGIEFLLYLNDVKQFALLFCNSKSSRNEIPNLNGKLEAFTEGKIEMPSLNLSSKYVEFRNGHSSQVLQILESEAVFDAPTVEQISEAIAKFNSVKSSEAPQKAEDAPSRER